jgi:hypothetical protein
VQIVASDSASKQTLMTRTPQLIDW